MKFIPNLKGFNISFTTSLIFMLLTRLLDLPTLKPSLVFCIFSIANILAACYTPIHDCDETFNYWEPAHYLSHGYGLQTWEYSPDYAIRSWLYIAIHAIIGNIRGLIPKASKVAEFYFIRYVLALTCSLCQTVMFRVIGNTLDFKIAFYFLISMVTSPGMFHAPVSFLPSSFSMLTVMLGITAFMDSSKAKISQGITWFSVGGIIGWPFSIVLCAPFLIREIYIACHCGKKAAIQMISHFKRGIWASIIVLLFEIIVSGLFYKRFVIVPFNIILYNVVSGPGPNLYGTEPWHFYIRNLLLNFNIWFVLAMLSLPFYTLQNLLSREKYMDTDIRCITFLSPFYLWLIIFSFQPHKEERFMYPIYPCIALNASISLNTILCAFEYFNSRTFPRSMIQKLKVSILLLFFISSIGLGIARIYGVYSAYSAPLRIYNTLMSKNTDNNIVCFGKDWYRFPNSYHLPDTMRAKFIKSEYKGLLPGEFFEAGTEYGIGSGTWRTPPGMNNQNIEDLGKYTDILTCNYLVDTYFPGKKASLLEPHYFLESNDWEIVDCAAFLDISQSAILGRILWMPQLPAIASDRIRAAWSKIAGRKWGEHCLMKHKRVYKQKILTLSQESRNRDGGSSILFK